MDGDSQKEWFADIKTVVREPLKFKIKLGIGEDAYKSLRLKKLTYKVWDVAGVASSAAVLAKSQAVAVLFSPWWVSLGIGTAATPIGIVVGAALISGASWYGITNYLNKYEEGRVKKIPDFINTPLDILAINLFDLLAPLSLKVAVVDGRISREEKKLITNYFVEEWGYNRRFVVEGLKFAKARLSEFSVEDLTNTLAEFQKQSPDCNFKSMVEEVTTFFVKIVESDGKIHQKEKEALDKIRNVFKCQGSIIDKIIKNAGVGLKGVNEKISKVKKKENLTISKEKSNL